MSYVLPANPHPPIHELCRRESQIQQHTEEAKKKTTTVRQTMAIICVFPKCVLVRLEHTHRPTEPSQAERNERRRETKKKNT